MADIFLVSNRIHVGMDEPKDTSKAWLRQTLTPYKLFDQVERVIDNAYDISKIIDENLRFGFSAYLIDNADEQPQNYLICKNNSWLPIVIENALNLEYDGIKLTLILPNTCSYLYDNNSVTLELDENYTVEYSNGRVKISI